MADLRKQLAQGPRVRVIDAVADGPNSVSGVTYKAIVPVAAGQRCQLLKYGDAPPLILGPVAASGFAVAGDPVTGTTAWQTLSLASANWTQTRPAQWRRNGANYELRGLITRTTSAFPVSSTFLSFAPTQSGNPPAAGQTYQRVTSATVAAASPTAVAFTVVVSSALTSAANTYAMAVGDSLLLDGISWPA